MSNETNETPATPAAMRKRYSNYVAARGGTLAEAVKTFASKADADAALEAKGLLQCAQRLGYRTAATRPTWAKPSHIPAGGPFADMFADDATTHDAYVRIAARLTELAGTGKAAHVKPLRDVAKKLSADLATDAA